MKTFKSIRQITGFLNNITNYEKELPKYTTRHYNLKSMRKIMKELGSPHLRFKSIHVAGSTGKGSVCHLLDSIYSQNGYKTGRYTSPHLTDIRERIAINNKLCAKQLFVKSFNEILNSIKRDNFTFFEILTSLAFYIFAKSRVDIAIIETGLGGRLDCTNIIKPEVCVLTPIEKEHSAILGKNIIDITNEKCGIIKYKVPVTAYDSGAKTTQIIKNYCRKTQSKLALVQPFVENLSNIRQRAGLVPPLVQRAVSSQGAGVASKPTYTQSDGFLTSALEINGYNFAIKAQNISLGHLSSSIIAIKTTEQIKQKFPVNINKLPTIVVKSQIPGRNHIISNDPLIIADNAHTIKSIRLLYDTLKVTGKKDVITIFSLLKDKEIKGITKTICKNSRRVFYTRTSSLRAYLPSKSNFTVNGKRIKVIPTLNESVKQAKKSLKKGSVILITGSTYLIAEAIKKLKN